MVYIKHKTILRIKAFDKIIHIIYINFQVPVFHQNFLMKFLNFDSKLFRTAIPPKLITLKKDERFDHLFTRCPESTIFTEIKI